MALGLTKSIGPLGMSGRGPRATCAPSLRSGHPCREYSCDRPRLLVGRRSGRGSAAARIPGILLLAQTDAPDAATTNRAKLSVYLPRYHRLSKGDDEVRIVVPFVQMVSAKIDRLMPRRAKLSLTNSSFKPKPP